MYAFSLSKLDKLEKQQTKSLKQTMINNSHVRQDVGQGGQLDN